MVDVLPTPGLPSIPVCVMRKSRRSGCGGCRRRPTAPGLRAVPTVSLPTNGSLSREEFESIGSETVRETIEKFETTDHRLSLTVSRQNPRKQLWTIYPAGNGCWSWRVSTMTFWKEPLITLIESIHVGGPISNSIRVQRRLSSNTWSPIRMMLYLADRKRTVEPGIASRTFRALILGQKKGLAVQANLQDWKCSLNDACAIPNMSKLKTLLPRIAPF
jgi:hypothetical protein